MNAVPRCFPDATIVCLGSGPSLTQADVDYCRGRAVTIAIKETLRLAPWADVFYFCDRKILEFESTETVKMRALVSACQGLKFTLDHLAHNWATVLQPGDCDGLSLDPTRLNTGKNSGYQAINLAVLLGAAKVVLLGYDMRAEGGKDHWFGAHAWKTRPPYEVMLQHFPTLVGPLQQAGVTVVNATKGSALPCWPYQPLAEALAVTTGVRTSATVGVSA